MIERFRRNCMGTTSFTGKFAGMRKEQEFVVYPVHAGHFDGRLKIQSDTRIGYVEAATGIVYLTRSFAGGAYNHHLMLAQRVDKLQAEELLLLKGHVMDSAGSSVGSRGVTTDNAGALEFFGTTGEAAVGI
ncbi:hypothetical protein [Noviherbaspirillum galbum]|uniref:Uncharacterized protein n=1 Tax=Noviherbaspirillum galbum TaxID=2709383 RepID=A0A6B3SHK8_9BURK|nr:hypothetical protein [Noviherbaspirillum galbum]NEX60143.1 hypothetical protein [Noviherbaspirillum galbum]